MHWKASVTKSALVLASGRPWRTYRRTASSASWGTGSSKALRDLLRRTVRVPDLGVEVLELEPRDVASPESDLGEQEKDCEIAQPDRVLAPAQRRQERAKRRKGPGPSATGGSAAAGSP